ncbi:hypothetical protein OsI_01420 [Oryza sativa Indica Group]|uniref:Uncharacterized protein n=1 Tax=Oryza sativa subsp. indica TaxID=39946 RepID=A2WNJ2_ORYSI|nr:hypothetical protein OsI_01420 [Oryza sativa Indica Group]
MLGMRPCSGGLPPHRQRLLESAQGGGGGAGEGVADPAAVLVGRAGSGACLPTGGDSVNAREGSRRCSGGLPPHRWRFSESAQGGDGGTGERAPGSGGYVGGESRIRRLPPYRRRRRRRLSAFARWVGMDPTAFAFISRRR